MQRDVKASFWLGERAAHWEPVFSAIQCSRWLAKCWCVRFCIPTFWTSYKRPAKSRYCNGRCGARIIIDDVSKTTRRASM